MPQGSQKIFSPSGWRPKGFCLAPQFIARSCFRNTHACPERSRRDAIRKCYCEAVRPRQSQIIYPWVLPTVCLAPAPCPGSYHPERSAAESRNLAYELKVCVSLASCVLCFSNYPLYATCCTLIYIHYPPIFTP